MTHALVFAAAWHWIAGWIVALAIVAVYLAVRRRAR